MRSRNPYHQRNPSHRNSRIPSQDRREGRLQQTHPIASLTTIIIVIMPTIIIVIKERRTVCLRLSKRSRTN